MLNVSSLGGRGAATSATAPVVEGAGDDCSAVLLWAVGLWSVLSLRVGLILQVGLGQKKGAAGDKIVSESNNKGSGLYIGYHPLALLPRIISTVLAKYYGAAMLLMY